MIPKIIHYCWFGGENIPADYQEYISEWEELHPDWQVIKWDETNFPMTCSYINTAVSKKNWANASNFARLKVLYEHGGVYLDTDIKLLKPLDNLLLDRCFLGFEDGNSENSTFWINNAVLGAELKHPFIAKCLESILNDFDGNEQANESAPKLITKVLVEDYGVKYYGLQQLKDGIKIYNKEVFYPIPWSLAKNVHSYKEHIYEDTVAVHMWGRTWFSKELMLQMIDDLQVWSSDQSKYILDLKNGLEYEQARVKTLEEKNQDLLSKSEQLLHLLQIQSLAVKEMVSKSALQTQALLQEIRSDVCLSNATYLKRLDESKYLAGSVIKNLNDAYSKQKKENDVLRQKLLEKQYELEACKSKLEESLYHQSCQQASILWYQRTYEHRSLLGVLKDKLSIKN